jgi:cyclophilin family peptidyl-prolyl cis-trans isomerase
LDGHYTAFGEVINGMAVVDQINQLKIDNREMPINNIYIKTEIIK